VLERISDVGTVHFACHARARTDNPLFSSLVLNDGELTLHDIRRLPRVPDRVIIAACSGGETVLASGDEVLSMAGSFLSSGARTVVAPLYTVSDEATALLMRSLYAQMEEGDDPAAALFAIRNGADLDLAFTAAVFACYGAA
jgi:CHAT domain-containing protein